MRKQLQKPFRIATSVYVALIFSLFLLFFDKNGLAAITAAKMVCYYALTLCYLAAMLFLFALQTIRKNLRLADLRDGLKHTPAAAWLILLYLIFTLISALLSDYDAVWLGGIRREGALTISLYCVSFLLVCRFYRPEKWHLYVFAAAATAFCCICVFQMLNINIFGLYPLGELYTCADFVDSFIGTIGNIDFTAAYLCIAVPILWCTILRLKGKARFLLFLPLLLCLAVLVRINVAAGYFGVFLGTLLSLPVVLPCAKKTRRIVLFVIAGLFLAALLAVFFHKFEQTELRQLHNILHGRIKDSYGSGRVYIWRRTAQSVPEHLWFGTGPDTLSLADFARQEVSDGQGNPLYIKVFDAAHNEYLTILFHQGIFALLAYLSALGVTLAQWIRQARTNTAAAIAGTAVVCYCLQAFFGISQLITSPFFWCVFAVTVALLHGKNEANLRPQN